MVIGFETGPAPLTAIWAIHEDNGKKDAPWRAIVAHWKSINYAAEKSKPPGSHPDPDYMGDVIDPRSTDKFPLNRIPNATVEGRILETNLQVSPFKADSKGTGDKLTFVIDGDAKEGDMPKYSKGERAFLCGFASHTPPSGKGGETVKPIYRDDFCTWGHINEDGGRIKWKIIPMYFIPHGSGILGLTDPSSKYKFGKPATTVSTFSQRRVAANVKSVLEPATENSVDDPVQSTDPATNTDGATDGVTDDFEIGKDMGFGGAEPTENKEVSPEDESFLTKPLQEADFGEQVAKEDKKATENGDDW